MNGDNKLVIDRFNAVIDGGTIDELDELCTPDLINHALVQRLRDKGLAGTKEFLRQGAASTGGRKDPHTSTWIQRWVVAEGDLVIEFGKREGNWPGGKFRGLEIPAGPYTRDVAFMYRLVDGKIA